MIKEYNERFRILQKEDLFLIAIFILMGMAIVLKSYFSSDGYLSNDSTNYLSLAQNLLDGNGFYISSLNSPENKFFAFWPVGYPFLIYAFAKLTGLSIFWASKALSIAFVGMILSLMRHLFNKNAYLYGIILFFVSFLEIFTYSWSETAFIFGLVWFTTSVLKFGNSSKRVLLFAISLLLSSLFLFLSRYIGIFSIGIIGLLGIYFGFVKKDRFKFILLIVICSINLLIISAYLYNNLIETGYITGMLRIPSTETNGLLLKNLLWATFGELVIISLWPNYQMKLVFLFLYTVMIALSFKYRKQIFSPISYTINKPLSIPFVFGLTGCIYLLSIILMRWTTHFDGFTFRLLGPGSFLIFIAAINYFETITVKKYFNAFKVLLLSASLSSLILNVPIKRNGVNQDDPIYNETIKEITSRYDKIERNSIIVFGDKHINYLSRDLDLAKPHSLPYSSEKESWAEFIFRINPENKRPIYLEVPRNLSIESFDISVVQLTEKYKPNTLVRLK